MQNVLILWAITIIFLVIAHFDRVKLRTAIHEHWMNTGLPTAMDGRLWKTMGLPTARERTMKSWPRAARNRVEGPHIQPPNKE